MLLRATATVLTASLLMAFTVGMKTVKIQTTAVCGMCKDLIENTLQSLDGVEDARLDLTTKKVRVKYDDTKQSDASLRLALTKIGYAADDLPADAEAVAALPGCCKGGKSCGPKKAGAKGCSGDKKAAVGQ